MKRKNEEDITITNLEPGTTVLGWISSRLYNVVYLKLRLPSGEEEIRRCSLDGEVVGINIKKPGKKPGKIKRKLFL